METNQRNTRHQFRVDGASKKSLQTTKKDVRDRKVNALTTIISLSKENSAAHTLIYIMSFKFCSIDGNEELSANPKKTAISSPQAGGD
ncbi:hypothetical protein [Synechococcus sp. CC9616]|uniref:hypothetical protein n=1 Tax=Synechococcus sp. CC9616 TaxID=110663 RepID=UPI00048FB72E|nr:hypothetical protein [Synechococcus sp. CC9616]